MNRLRPFPAWLAALALAAADPGLTAQEPAFPPLPEIPAGGVELVAPADIAKATLSSGPDVRGRHLGGAASPGATAWQVEVLRPLPNAWSAKLAVPVRGTIRAGDSCLLAFHARATGNHGGTAGGTVQVDGSPAGTYAKALAHEFEVGTGWHLVLVPFPAMQDLTETSGQISFLVGTRAQSLEIANTRLWNFGANTPVARLPRSPVSYAGREPGAPWRKQALERVEKIRKADFLLTVTDAAGKPLPGASLTIRQRRHDFGFGSAVVAYWLNHPSANGARYREIVDEYFSRVVLENDLKEHGWRAGLKTDPPDPFYRREWTENALDWLAARHIQTRGHCLTWGVFDSTTEPFRKDPAKLRARLLEHLAEVVPAVGAKVIEWDAINHPASWSPSNRLELALGPGYYVEVMRRAVETGRVPMWLNEDQVYRPGRQQEEYFAVAKRLVDAGVPPAGLGIQGHFHCSFLPSPAEMLRVSDRFAALVPRLQVTEFDIMANGDEALQADWLRDCLIMAFSHPAYTGFQLWGFWEPTVVRKEAMPWKADWSERAHARVWKTWVGEYWRSQSSGLTDEGGRFRFRGYHGRYTVGVDLPGKRCFTEVVLNAGSNKATVATE